MNVCREVEEAPLVALLKKLDAGAGESYVLLVAGDKDRGRLLSRHALARPAGRISDGKLVLHGIAPDEKAAAKGAPSWARFYNGNDEWALDLKAPQEVTVSPKIIEEGQLVEITDAVFSIRKP